MQQTLEMQQSQLVRSAKARVEGTPDLPTDKRKRTIEFWNGPAGPKSNKAAWDCPPTAFAEWPP